MKHTKNINSIVSIFIAAVFTILIFAQITVFAQAEDKATLILKNAKIYTVNDNQKWASAVAIKDKRILFVGDDDEIYKYIDSNTKVVDLKGKMVLPGLHDTHIHALEGSLVSLMCIISEGNSLNDYANILKQYVNNNPDKKYIEAFGYQTVFFQDKTSKKELLDEIAPNRPIFVLADDGHSAWVNSKALEVAGITKDTPNPLGGVFEKDKEGELTGVLIEQPAMDAVHKLNPTISKIAPALEATIEEYNRNGITSYVDARVRKNHQAIYRQIHNSSDYTLNARIALALLLDSSTAEQDIDGFGKRFRYNPRAKLNHNQAKIFIDGVTENKTALLRAPYIGTNNKGISYFTAEKLNEYVTKLDKIGYQVHFHAIGDQAVKMALDSIEAARNTNGIRDSRHIITHVGLLDPSDAPRFKELGVIASLQLTWGSPTIKENILLVGMERYNNSYPAKTLLDAGATIAGASDFPANEFLSPFAAMQVAITRQEPLAGENSPILNINQRLSLEDMIKAYTINGAYLMKQEKYTGSIERGKLADLIVLDRNLFEVSKYDLYKTKVLLTLFDGKKVYSDDNFEF